MTATSTSRRVVVVDGDEIVRIGLAALLDDHPDLDLADGCARIAEATELLHRTRPDVAIVDTHLPDGDGLVLAAHLADAGIPCLVMSTVLDAREVDRARAGGARGYLSLRAPSRELVTAIRRVAEGGAPDRFLVGPDPEPLDDDRWAAARLTPREITVFWLLADGLTNQRIATTLGLSPATVKNHVQRVLVKLGFSRRTELIPYAASCRARRAACLT